MIGWRVYDACRAVGWLTEEADHLFLYYRAGSYAAACVSYLMQAMGRESFWEFYRHLTARNYRSLLEATLNAELTEINAAFREHIRSFEDLPALFWKVLAENGNCPSASADSKERGQALDAGARPHRGSPSSGFRAV
jgi:hypothetical protein